MKKAQTCWSLRQSRAYGGLCRSRTDKGFTFDIGGSHIIFSRDTEVLAFMRRMIRGNEQQNTRNTKIFYKGRYVNTPSKTAFLICLQRTASSASVSL